MWVWISCFFDATSIAKAIYESLLDEATSLTQLSTIMKHVQRVISGQRFLLVLDDVWEGHSKKWEDLKDFLSCGLPGSKVLVTTRNDEVAITMGCDMLSDTFHPEKLGYKDCCSIFCRFAFSGKGDSHPEYLKEVGEKIVEKCQGLPLAAKTLGSLLRSETSREKWESVLNSKLWDQQDAKKRLLAPIWLSYSELLLPWRQCFSYCAVFPKGYRIEKHKLIEMWMAQGYLKETPGRSMEIVGEEYFQKLAGRSLFQDFEKDEDDGSIISCKMHDMAHDVAEFTAKNECFLMGIEGAGYPKQDSSYNQLRHTTIKITPQTPNRRHLNSLKKLRTLLVVSTDPLEPAQLNLFTQWRCLRSLKLSHCDIVQIPTRIGELIHLRWLDLSYNGRLKELPEELCELYNLQTLDATGCWSVMTLPRGIGSLVHLTHLHIDTVGRTLPLPKEIGMLTNLRTLEFFFVGSNTGETASLSDLRNLNHLRGKLHISWSERMTEADEAKRAQLSRKNISDLRLWFYEGDEKRRIQNDTEALDALEPSPNLISLSVYQYQGITLFPKWLLSLTSLRKVRLLYCRNCLQLPPLGKLPALEDLFLEGMSGVKNVGAEFLGLDANSDVAFPKLTKLDISSLGNWEDWYYNGNPGKGTIMPCLRNLSLYFCQKLGSLPDYILQNVKLEEVILDMCPALETKYPIQEWPKFTYK